MPHKYLNDIGIESTDPCIFNTDAIEEPKYQDDYNKEKSVHNFDCRETFGMDYTSATWLYEHLQAYKEWAGKVVNLNFHTFSIPILYDIPNNKLEYIKKEDGTRTDIVKVYMYDVYEKHTQLEAINRILSYLEYYFNKDKIMNYMEDEIKREQKQFEYLQGAFRIYAEIIPSMWW